MPIHLFVLSIQSNSYYSNHHYHVLILAVADIKKDDSDMDAETEGLPPMQSEANSHVIDLKARRRVLKSQPSTLATRRQQAVCVRRAHKIYGTKRNPHVILDGLNMTVPKGTMWVIFIKLKVKLDKRWPWKKWANCHAHYKLVKLFKSSRYCACRNLMKSYH